MRFSLRTALLVVLLGASTAFLILRWPEPDLPRTVLTNIDLMYKFQSNNHGSSFRIVSDGKFKHVDAETLLEIKKDEAALEAALGEKGLIIRAAFADGDPPALAFLLYDKEDAVRIPPVVETADCSLRLWTLGRGGWDKKELVAFGAGFEKRNPQLRIDDIGDLQFLYWGQWLHLHLGGSINRDRLWSRKDGRLLLEEESHGCLTGASEVSFEEWNPSGYRRRFVWNRNTRTIEMKSWPVPSGIRGMFFLPEFWIALVTGGALLVTAIRNLRKRSPAPNAPPPSPPL